VVKKQRWAVTMCLAVVSVVMTAGMPGRAGAAPPQGRTTTGIAHLYDWDPLRLIAVDALRTHTLGVDVIEVWACDGPGGAALDPVDLAWSLRDWGIVEYFRWWSNGRYEPRFVPAGTIATSDPDTCRSEAMDRSPGTSTAALLVLDHTAGGRAVQGRFACGTGPYDCDLSAAFPANGRYAQVGLGFVTGGGVDGKGPAGLIHEIGHMLGWPHSFSGYGDEYDNRVDVMSGLGAYGTIALNRYAAGWIDPSAVAVASPTGTTVMVGAHGTGRFELLVVPTTELGRYYTVEVRRASQYDWMDGRAAGVQVHLIDQGNDACDRPPIAGFPCFGGARRTSPYPANTGFDHVLGPGDRLQLPGGLGLAWTLEVVRAADGGFEIRIVATQVPTCAGLPATIVGTTESDIIVGTAQRDVIVALDGDDQIGARAGDDVVCAGTGDDRILGGPGDDHLVGGQGDDHLTGGPGRDLLSGDDGDDTIKGSGDADIVYGGAGSDRVFAGPDADSVYGGSGDDVLKGGGGDDLLNGGDGFDELFGGGGADTCQAGGVLHHC
jgi:hypothetical protein